MQIYVLFLEKGWNFWILYKGKGFQIPTYQNHTKTSLFPWLKKSSVLSEQLEMTTVRWIVFWPMVFSQSTGIQSTRWQPHWLYNHLPFSIPRKWSPHEQSRHVITQTPLQSTLQLDLVALYNTMCIYLDYLMLSTSISSRQVPSGGKRQRAYLFACFNHIGR